MRADLFNRAAWQLHSRAHVEVYAWMPVLAIETNEPVIGYYGGTLMALFLYLLQKVTNVYHPLIRAPETIRGFVRGLGS